MCDLNDLLFILFPIILLGAWAVTEICRITIESKIRMYLFKRRLKKEGNK